MMKASLLSALLVLIALHTCAQNVFTVYIKDKASKEPLAGATINIEGTSVGTSATPEGVATLTGISNGKQVIHFKSVGYVDLFDSVSFPLVTHDTITVFMDAANEEMDEVTVSSTRSSRTIQDLPTRIELISGEELGEKSNMKPGDIKMVLSESTGIQTLQTSATSGNSAIRIQGMDGRYTQILKDGFPLYDGFSGGLGLMQTPPLDLKRVEIIKGASSTLYGGGAIAGLINLISKTPSPTKELRFNLNATSAGGVDASGFYSKLKNKFGVMLFGAFNSSPAYAPANTTFTAIPYYRRYTLNPKVFFYPNSKVDVLFGINSIYENRKGGDIQYINHGADSVHSYFEDNKCERISSIFEIRRRFENTGTLTLKNSLNHFNRILNTPATTFDGTQFATFTEMNYVIHKGKLEWIAGTNLITDNFQERKFTNIPLRNYDITTCGIFLENIWDVSKHFILESGLRTDYVAKYGAVVLPRISMLFKFGTHFSSRLGGGLGYKTPTLFTEESERVAYMNIQPLSPTFNKLERSYGANWDVNYKTTFADGKVTFSVNQLIFYTMLKDPLLLSAAANNTYQFENLVAHFNAKGAETNMKVGYGHFKLFLGYTFTYSLIENGDIYRETPLTPMHHTNSVLMYEVENKWKIGAEAYYYSPQRLNDGTIGRDYWLCGFMAERIWKHMSVYINFENLLDSRQTRYESIYSGTIAQPVFRDIYAPLDGFVANGGIKINL